MTASELDTLSRAELVERVRISERCSAGWKALAKWCHTKWQRRRREVGFDENEDLRLERMGPSGNGFEIVLSGRWVVTEMARALRHLLDDAKAPNTIECRLTDHRGDGIIVEVRRQHGKTMAQLRDEAIARAELAERAVHATLARERAGTTVAVVRALAEHDAPLAKSRWSAVVRDQSEAEAAFRAALTPFGLEHAEESGRVDGFRVELADSEDAFAALSFVFAEIGKAYATPCDCGHLSGEHDWDDRDGECPHCDCPGFFTAFARTEGT